ncbi:hypothetical protein [Burkholderia vietnamiensis]|uniref:hypothetical protein n=1 Tax=Burkholderia vietnamiensis TaxID=60552 RepID=UPI001CF4B94D|nr:hypothetical protein [Burkholderia vietnamiensis]MCA8148167.1 hypothetical protein [Burkholderia vietnamiensis]
MEQLGNTYEDRFTDPDDQAEPALEFTADALATGAKGGKAPVVIPDVDDVDLSKPLAPTHDENKGFMRFMPALIKEMNRKGVPFTIDGNTGIITISGFYKNGPMTLEVEANDDIVAIDKRARRKVMKTYDDLVKLNFFWWQQSTGQGVPRNPDRPWLDAFLDKGWVRRSVIYLPSTDQAPVDDE